MLLSKSNTFDKNFMKLCHIEEYHDVFIKFDNGPYQTMPSVVTALCLFKTMSTILVEYSLSEFYESWSHCLVL